MIANAVRRLRLKERVAHQTTARWREPLAATEVAFRPAPTPILAADLASRGRGSGEEAGLWNLTDARNNFFGHAEVWTWPIAGFRNRQDENYALKILRDRYHANLISDT